MNAKQCSAWLLAAGITTLISVVSALQDAEQIDTNNTIITLANMSIAQKDSVIRAEIHSAKTGEEIVSLRKKNTKIFKDNNGKFKAQIFSSSKHYFDEETGTYKNIDLTINEIANEAKSDPKRKFDKYVDAGNYRATWFDDNPHDYTFYYGDYYVKYEALFDTTGITIQTKPNNRGVKQYVILNDSTATNVLSWKIHSNALYELNNGSIVFKDTSGTVLFNMPSLWAEDEELKQIILTTNVSSDTLTCAVDIPQDAVYPVTVDPTTAFPDTDAKTGRLYSGDAVYLTARNATSSDNVTDSDIRVGQRTNVEIYRTPLTFDTSGITDGSIITSAVLTLVAAYTVNVDDFNMVLVEGTYDDGNLATGWWNDFTGWASSGAYSITQLSNAVNSSGVSEGDSLVFTFNSTGKGIINDTGLTKIMLMSEEDVNASAPANSEWQYIEDDSPYLLIAYTTKPSAPANFTMDNPSKTTISAHYTRIHSENVDSVGIANASDNSLVKYYDSVTDTITTVTDLSVNTRYTWLAYVDSAGIKSYSNIDTLYTIIDPPGIEDITIIPIGSDTLRISVTEPPNPATGLTGMQVEAVSGSGATSSGWLDGQYTYLDGGVNPDSTHVYKVRYRNGEGDSTAWSPDITYSMNGLDTLVIYLGNDSYDDYNVDFGSGRTDSTVVRAGASNSGERLDGFFSFDLPWRVVKGGVDSLFLSMTRTDEQIAGTPVLKLYGIPEEDIDPVEELNLGAQDSTGVTVNWTIGSGEGEKTSPDMRVIFRAWQDLAVRYGFQHGFGLRLDDNAQADSVRAVFLDVSNPSYSNGTKLTIYYTPGEPDLLDGKPDDFAMTVFGPDSLRAEWTDNSTTEYGYLLCNLVDSTAVAEVDSLNKNTTSVDVRSLTPNTVYEWFVKAYTVYDDSTSSSDSKRTPARVPGKATVYALSDTTLSVIIDPQDNPSWTAFAVQDSITGKYVDGTAEPDTLRSGSLGEWGWRTYSQWGSAAGDTLTGLKPDSLYVIRVKARSEE